MASKRALRRKSCTRKRKYTRQQAHLVAYKARNRTHEWILPYKCSFCKKWHIGHPPKQVKQSIKSKNRYY